VSDQVAVIPGAGQDGIQGSTPLMHRRGPRIERGAGGRRPYGRRSPTIPWLREQDVGWPVLRSLVTDKQGTYDRTVAGFDWSIDGINTKAKQAHSPAKFSGRVPVNASPRAFQAAPLRVRVVPKAG